MMKLNDELKTILSINLSIRIMNFQLTSMSLTLIEKHFIKKLSDLWDHEFYSKPIDGITEHLKYIISEMHKLQNKQINDILPQIIWSSIFVFNYGEFENSLNRLSKIFAEKLPLHINESDLKDRGIIRSKKYLSKVVGLDLNVEDELWQRLLKYLKIRNILLHNAGTIDKKNDKNLYNYINSIDSINLIDSSKMEFNNLFINETLNDYVSFLEYLLNIFSPSYKDELIDLTKFTNS